MPRLCLTALALSGRLDGRDAHRVIGVGPAEHSSAGLILPGGDVVPRGWQGWEVLQFDADLWLETAAESVRFCNSMLICGWKLLLKA
eukprot:Skav227265  [mRNA]  locus=scaffold3417:137593:138095:- [translate_table: standard]